MKERYVIKNRFGDHIGTVDKEVAVRKLPIILFIASLGVLFLAYKAWPYLTAEVVKQFTTGDPEVSIYLCVSMGGVILGCIGGFIRLIRETAKNSKKNGLILNTMNAACYTAIGSFVTSLTLSYLLLVYSIIESIIDKSFHLGYFILTLIGMPIISAVLSIIPVFIVAIVAGITASIYETIKKI